MASGRRRSVASASRLAATSVNIPPNVLPLAYDINMVNHPMVNHPHSSQSQHATLMTTVC